jgi:hypothetical protein
MSQRRVLVVTIEGFGTNLVGSYGAAMVPTKNLDQFASRSIVWDQCWSDSGSAIETLRSMWFGTHALERRSRHDSCLATPNLLFESALFVTDALDLLESIDVEHFGESILVESLTASERNPKVSSDCDIEELDGDEVPTQVQRLFEAALGKWSSVWDKLPILWIHSKGLLGSWDAPYEYRKIMCDEGDPEPPKSPAPATLQITDTTDPDEVFGLTCAMGGQAIAIDQAWGLLIAILDELGIGDDCLQVLCGIHGYPAGEHGWVGFGPTTLYSETLHVPLMLRPGNQLMLGKRVSAMTHPFQVMQAIGDWLTEQNMPSFEFHNESRVAISVEDQQVHLASPSWACRWSSDSESNEAIELFAMPDDRWQQNEVAARAPEVCDKMKALRDSIVQCDQTIEFSNLLVTTDQELIKSAR